MSREKKLLFSVTKDDFELQTFTVGGNGGGGKDTSNSGVRLIHRASGAVGVGTEHRTNSANRESALRKLVKTKEFLGWHRMECARRLNQPIPETPEQIKRRVDQMVTDGLKNGSILIETSGPNGEWVSISTETAKEG